MEEQGFEPWAFRMQSGRSATELHPQICIGRGRGTVAAREVAALAHEVRDDAVEGGALEVERLARAARACVGTYRRHTLYDRYAIRTRNLQDWNLTRCRCANRSSKVKRSRGRRRGTTRGRPCAGGERWLYRGAALRGLLLPRRKEVVCNVTRPTLRSVTAYKCSGVQLQPPPG